MVYLMNIVFYFVTPGNLRVEKLKISETKKWKQYLGQKVVGVHLNRKSTANDFNASYVYAWMV